MCLKLLMLGEITEIVNGSIRSVNGPQPRRHRHRLPAQTPDSVMCNPVIFQRLTRNPGTRFSLSQFSPDCVSLTAQPPPVDPSPQGE
jgi:hypothetical protein